MLRNYSERDDIGWNGDGIRSVHCERDCESDVHIGDISERYKSSDKDEGVLLSNILRGASCEL